jgi:hypothetical protein
LVLIKRLISRLHVNYLEKQKRLIPLLGNRTKYVVHLRNVQFYLQNGMKSTKVHRVMTFTQTNWLSKYIMMNTKLRSQTSTAFERIFYKNMNNFIFGKTMENKRNHVQVKLTNNPLEAKKFISKSNFESYCKIEGDLYTFCLKAKTVTLDKPCYLGFTILDLSKLAMYDFHYNNIEKWYGEKAKLGMTNTDSLLKNTFLLRYLSYFSKKTLKRKFHLRLTFSHNVVST